MIDLVQEISLSFSSNQVQDPLTSLPAPTIVNSSWTVPKELSYFDGHFPGNPILPAIAIIDISNELLNRALSKSLYLTSIKTAKFTGLVIPGLTVQIRAILVAPAEWQVDWTNSSGDSSISKLASLRLIF